MLSVQAMDLIETADENDVPERPKAIQKQRSDNWQTVFEAVPDEFPNLAEVVCDMRLSEMRNSMTD
jgi:hypothetical protein